jgi:hypothetical protein
MRGVALGILSDELLKIIRELHLREPAWVVNRPGFKQTVQVANQRRAQLLFVALCR